MLKNLKTITAFLVVALIISGQIFLPSTTIACNYNQQCLDLTIQKTARNITAGQQNYTDSTNANNGDQIQFQIQVQNTGNSILKNVVIKDTVPTGLIYQTNSVLISGVSIFSNTAVNNYLTINIGSLEAGASITITFKTAVSTSGSVDGTQSIINTASARADEVGEKSDTATVVVASAQNNLDLSIDKTVRDITASQTGYIDSVAAQNNDRLMYKIEIHNTGNGALNNVIVRDILPSQISFVSGTVRVDQAAGSDSFVNGGINIGTLGTGSARLLTFEAIINVSGFSGLQTLVNQAFARADQISEKNDSASAVVATPFNNRDLSIVKTVRNETGGGNFTENVNANNNDQVMFQIQITNTGNITLNNVFVRDALPSGLSYVSGSAKINGSPLDGSLVSGGDNLGDLTPNTSRIINLEAIVNSNSGQTLTNYAYARADQVSEKNDSASVIVNSASTNNLNLSIAKTVRNETSGQGFSDSASANNGDQLQFQIQIQNTGSNTLNNIAVRDVLPSFISYNNGSTRADGYFVSDGITSGGINVGSLSAGSSKTVTFESTVNFFGFSGSQNLTNTAFARADQVGERSDSATVFINQQFSTGNLNLTKYVRNLTRSETGLIVSTNANQGDTVLFTIQVSTQNSSQQVNNVKVWDNLPSGLNLVSGTTRLDNGLISDNLFVGGSGINIGTIVGNQTRTITFQATVNSSVNNQTLINYAYATADNVPQQTAFAQVVIGQTGSQVGGATLTKKVTNLTAANGTDTDNSAAVGNTLQYTITLINNGSAVLNNVQIADVLPSYTSFQSADNGGSYNSSSNQVNWNNGNPASGTSISFTYRVTVNAVPFNGFVITNTAAARADNLSVINSNEVRTTIGKTSGVVKAVTGSDNLTRNIAVAGIVSLWAIFILYLLMEYGYFWQNAKIRLVILKLKLKNRLN